VGGTELDSYGPTSLEKYRQYLLERIKNARRIEAPTRIFETNIKIEASKEIYRPIGLFEIRSGWVDLWYNTKGFNITYQSKTLWSRT